MAVALNTTLISHGISTLLYKGQWERVVDRKTVDATIFIGAGVTETGETQPDVALAAVDESILGIVLGYVPQLETIDAQGYFYRDYDNPFATGSWIRIGIPKNGNVIFLLSGTNITIARGEKLECVDGVWVNLTAATDNYQVVSLEAVTGAADTRKYFYGRWGI